MLLPHLPGLLVISACLLTSLDAHSATTAVVPNSLANSSGNSNNSLPFESVFARRYQQVYGSPAFSSIVGPTAVIAIAFRLPLSTVSGEFTASIPDVEIRLSTTSAAPDGLSLTFDDNLGADETIVFTGLLTFSSPNVLPSTGTKEFDLIIEGQTPFLYDPSLGNLLLDVRTPLGGNGTNFGFDAESVVGDDVSRVFDFGNLGTLQDTFGLVTQFTFVPEPSPAILIALGIGALAASHRKRRPTPIRPPVVNRQ